jgi:hypothetical protein
MCRSPNWSSFVLALFRFLIRPSGWMRAADDVERRTPGVWNPWSPVRVELGPTKKKKVRCPFLGASPVRASASNPGIVSTESACQPRENVRSWGNRASVFAQTASQPQFERLPLHRVTFGSRERGGLGNRGDRASKGTKKNLTRSG